MPSTNGVMQRFGNRAGTDSTTSPHLLAIRAASLATATHSFTSSNGSSGCSSYSIARQASWEIHLAECAEDARHVEMSPPDDDTFGLPLRLGEVLQVNPEQAP